MNCNESFLNHPNMGKLFLRLGTGGLMLFHGIFKIRTNIAEITYWMATSGLPQFLAYGVYIGEVIAPILILCGIFVRSASLIVAFNMLVAIFYLHIKGFGPFGLNEFGGLSAELDVLFLFSALALVFLGGGKYGLSGARNKMS